jgi:hypothetical protein
VQAGIPFCTFSAFGYPIRSHFEDALSAFSNGSVWP